MGKRGGGEAGKWLGDHDGAGVGFPGVALLFYVDRHRKMRWTFLISVAFAGGIELVQWILPYREGDWLDFVAGAAGDRLGSRSGALERATRP